MDVSRGSNFESLTLLSELSLSLQFAQSQRIICVSVSERCCTNGRTKPAASRWAHGHNQPSTRALHTQAQRAGQY